MDAQVTRQYTTTRRVRVNITRNTKGFTYDTTVEVTTDDPTVSLIQALDDLNLIAADNARTEIERRQRHDAIGGTNGD